MIAANNIYVFHGVSPGTGIALNNIDSLGGADANYNIAFVNPQGNIRFKQADDSLKNIASPIPIPAAGFKYSYRKSMKIKWTTPPPAQITNLRLFSDGASIATGVLIRCGTDANYIQGVSGDANADVMSGGTLTQVADIATRTVGSPLIINAGVVATVAGFGTQDFLVQQVEVASTASAGSTPDRLYTYRYDEA